MKPTQEQVIAWAREAGFSKDWQGTWHCIFAQMNEAFTLAYKAGAAAEREACANVAAWILKMPENDVSAAIRARGTDEQG